MALTDPRALLRAYFSKGPDGKIVDANLTLPPDDVTPADYEAQYVLTENRLRNLFYRHELDIVFIVDRPNIRPIVTSSGVIAYVHEVTVQPTIIDKWKVDGTVSVEATILMDKAQQEVRRVLNANMAGSFRLIDQEQPRSERLGSTILYGIAIAVMYTQFVTTYGTYSVPIRRFTNYVAEWRVGTTAAVYASVGQSSGIGFRFAEDDPWVKLPIPTGSTSVYQLIMNFDVTGVIAVNDYEAATALLYETDVDNATGGNQYAVSATGRTVIDYMAIVIYHTKIVNATDVRSSPTSTFSFTNAKIRHIQKPFEQVADPWIIHFYADSCTQTDSA